ncbi:MAG: carboxypeptidase-like regulatory domain-containing protein, partial [Bacteroidota bacterium]
MKENVRNANSTNVKVNGKLVDSISAGDPFTLTFSFTQNSVSAKVNIYADINKNGIVDSSDIPIILNGLIFDNGEDDANPATGECTVEFGVGNFQSTILTTMIFEVDDYQSISSARLVILEKMSRMIIFGSIKPHFTGTVVQLMSSVNQKNWFRTVFPDSAGNIQTYYDTLGSGVVNIFVGNVEVTPAGYLPPKDTLITIKTDTNRFVRTFTAAKEFIEGYVKDQNGDPVKNAFVYTWSNHSRFTISAKSNNVGYYLLGVEKGDWTVYADMQYTSDDYLHRNYRYEYIQVAENKTVRKDFMFLKANSTISGTVKYGSVGIGGIQIGAFNDSISNINFSSSNGTYSVKVFKPVSGNLTYSLSAGMNDYAFFIDSSFRQNIPAGSSNINFEVKKVNGGLQGKLVDFNTGTPVPHADMNISGPVYRYVQSDDSGKFKVLMPKGTYSININAQNYESYFESGIVIGESFTTKTIMLSRMGSLSGTVKDESGGSIKNFSITARDTFGSYYGNYYYSGTNNYSVTGLQTGKYKVQASAPGYISQWFNGKSTMDSAAIVSVVKGFDTPNINFVLSRGGSISGIVKDKNGKGVSNASVFALDTTYDDISMAITDDSGKYIVYGLPSGVFYVAVTSDDYLLQFYPNTPSYKNAQKIPVVINQTTANINFSVLKGSSISGTVVNKLGNPILSAEVLAIDTATFSIQYVYTNDSGKYQIKKLTPGVKLFLYARAQGYSRRWYVNAPSIETAQPLILIEEEHRSGINFVLPLSGKITGTVKNMSGTPLQYAYVRADLVNGNNSYGTSSDQFGDYSIVGLEGGKYFVTASTNNYTQQWYNHKPSLELADTVKVDDEITI